MFWSLRAAAILSMGLWLAALVGRFDVYLHGFGYNYGWFLLVLGWIGPLELSFAWFANIPYLICIYQLLRGQIPRTNMVLGSCALASTALVPHFELDKDGRFHPVLFWGPAVWLWLLAFIPILATVLVRRTLDAR